MKDPIAPLRQQLQQLKSLHESGTLDAQAYAAAKAPLEKKLLDHVMDVPGAVPAAEPAPRPSWNLIGLSTVLVLIVAGGGYLWTGSPGMPSALPGSQPRAEAAATGEGHSTDDAQFAAAVEQLAERMKAEPDNSEGWAILARSYARLGRHADAVGAFEKAVALAPQDARLLADYADTAAMQNGRSLEGAPMKLVDRALKIDPDNPKALALAGTAAFNRKDYPTAVKRWERLAQVVPSDAGFMQQLQGSIDEARSLAGLPPGPRIAQAAPAAPMPSAAPAADAAPGGAPVAATSTTVVSGTVRLSAALAKQAAPTDTVFIYARPAEGSRMPLAIQRHQVKDLPIEFKLDDSMAMSPAAKISMFPKVIISARVSKGSQAAASPGDLTGQSAPVANDARGLVVEINELVK